MRFVVHCLDKPGALPLRLANYEAHKSYLATGSVATVVSGPLLADDGETMIGSMLSSRPRRRKTSWPSIRETRSRRQGSGGP